MLTSDTEVTEALSDGDRGTVFVRRCCSMRQAAVRKPIPVIRTADGEFRVEDTIKLLGGRSVMWELSQKA